MEGAFISSSERLLKGGSGSEASLAMGARLGELGGGEESFVKGLKGYERKALGIGISLHGCSAGQTGVGLSTGGFERWTKGALGMEYLSLKRLRGGGLGWELLHWGPCLGNVVLRKTPQSTFGVSVRP
jgi:hypothetical protein